MAHVIINERDISESVRSFVEGFVRERIKQIVEKEMALAVEVSQQKVAAEMAKVCVGMRQRAEPLGLNSIIEIELRLVTPGQILK